MKSITWKSILVVFLILLADQSLKIWVKATMDLHDRIFYFGENIQWAQLYFIENNGMAFGLEFGGSWGKILLTSFRILAVIAIGIYMRSLVRKNAHTGLILTLAMVMAGALGNIIDSVFYGVIYGGYAPDFDGKLFQGRVVDMLYFPIIRDSNDNPLFFRPIFNIADSSITVAVGLILIFQKRFFRHLQKEEGKGESLTSQ